MHEWNRKPLSEYWQVDLLVQKVIYEIDLQRHLRLITGTIVKKLARKVPVTILQILDLYAYLKPRVFLTKHNRNYDGTEAIAN